MYRFHDGIGVIFKNAKKIAETIRIIVENGRLNPFGIESLERKED